jgi:hypothetical protein
MPFRPPCRDDSALGFRDIRENDRNFEAACNSISIDANFAVIEAIIDSLSSVAIEDPDGVLEREAMQCDVPPVLPLVPSAGHCLIFTLCIYAIRKHNRSVSQASVLDVSPLVPGA